MRWASRDSATLAWIGIAVLVISYVVAYDLWAHFAGHRLMTLHHPVAGPIIFALWVAVPVGLTYHFLMPK